jgi:PIN domain nuclease of toxin-antitoxin system
VNRYLVDTHVWLWMQAEPDRLRDQTRAIVEDAHHDLLFSAAASDKPLMSTFGIQLTS